MSDKPVLTLEPNDSGKDYVLEAGESCWIQVGDILIYIVDLDGGVSATALPCTDPGGDAIEHLVAYYRQEDDEDD